MVIAGDTTVTAACEYAAAFTALRSSARRAAARVVGWGDDAEDIAQEALARAFERWEQFERIDNACAWVNRVSRNLAIDALRHRRQVPATAEPAQPSKDVEALDRLVMQAALASLAPRQRAALALRYLEDQSLLYTATAMGCSLSTVRQSSTRGLKHLRARMVANS